MGSTISDSQKIDYDEFPIEINGHHVTITTPNFTPFSPIVEYDENTSFTCTNCDHEINRTKNAIKASRFVKNAFNCVNCTHVKETNTGGNND